METITIEDNIFNVDELEEALEEYVETSCLVELRNRIQYDNLVRAYAAYVDDHVLSLLKTMDIREIPEVKAAINERRAAVARLTQLYQQLLASKKPDETAYKVPAGQAAG